MLQSETTDFLGRWRNILAPHSMGYRIKLLSQLLYRKLQDRLEPLGLTPFHWLVLSCLWLEDGLPTSEICERLNEVGGTLTGVLDRMEERGLIRRQRDPEDRRIWRIWLTPAGNDLREVLPPRVLELRQQLCQGISLREYELFAQILDQVIQNVSRHSASK